MSEGNFKFQLFMMFLNEGRQFEVPTICANRFPDAENEKIKQSTPVNFFNSLNSPFPNIFDLPAPWPALFSLPVCRSVLTRVCLPDWDNSCFFLCLVCLLSWLARWRFLDRTWIWDKNLLLDYSTRRSLTPSTLIKLTRTISEYPSSMRVKR